MLRNIFWILPLFLFSQALTANDLDTIIDRARDFLAPNERLNAIDSLLYEGVLIPEGDGVSRKVALYLQKPNRQRLEIIDEGGKVAMVVNGKEGFMIQENFANDQRRISLLPADQIRRFTANAVENLYFYKFPPRAQVRARYMGPQEFRGEMTDAVRYIHPGNSMFIRYFDPETGELKGTATDAGVVNVEDGFIVVDGIRFSETVLSYQGEQYEHKIVFDNIEVNPDFDAEVFAFPSFDDQPVESVN